MATDKPSVILISKDGDVGAGLKEPLEASGAFDVIVQSKSLTQVNGAAVAMAQDHDLLLFHLGDETDLDAVRELRAATGGDAMVVAVTENDLPLSKVLELKSIGIDEILPYPLPEDVLRQQIGALLARRQGPPGTTGRLEDSATLLGDVIAVVPARGGIGASTLAINLADQLQERTGILRKTAKHRVAVVDLDLQFGSVASALDIDPTDTLLRMASEGLVPDETYLRQSMVAHGSGLSVVTAPPEFIPLDAITRDQVAALLTALRRDFDYVVVDLPRVLSEWIAPVINQAARILMVTDSTVPAIRQAYRLTEFYGSERFDPPVEIVVNFEKKPLVRAAHHAEAAKVLKRPLAHWLPPDPRAARTALDRGALLADSAGGSALNKAIRALGRKILSEAGTRQATDIKTHKEGYPDV